MRCIQRPQVLILNIRRVFYNHTCQNHFQSKVPSCCKALNNLAIGRLIMCNFFSTPPILSWGSKRCDYPFILWAYEHEVIFEYVIAYIAFRYLHEKKKILQILKCAQYGWEECIVILSRMGLTSIIEWCMFNDRCLSKKEHTML